MRAVVDATGSTADLSAVNKFCPTPLVPAVDRPFVHHVVAYLVDRGVTEIDFVLSDFPEQIEESVGDGSRWGVAVKYHISRDANRPYGKVTSLSFADPNEPVVFAHADRLPGDKVEFDGPASRSCRIVGIAESDNSAAAPRPIGWARVPAGLLRSLPATADEPGAMRLLTDWAQDAGEWCIVPDVLSVRSYADFLAAQRKLLESEPLRTTLFGRDFVEPAWVSRNVVIHPKATVRAPVFIGENSRIGPHVHLGPNAYVGHDCVIDERTMLHDALVFSGSYVGEGLDLSGHIIDRTRTIDVESGAAVSVLDAFVLANLTEKSLQHWFARTVGRVVALGMLIAALPILILTAAILRLARMGRQARHYTEAIRLPAEAEEFHWKPFRLVAFACGDEARGGIAHFFLRFLPGLIHVVRGEMHFVGVAPRSADEIRALPDGWRSLYLKSKPGLVTEALVYHGVQPSTDDLFAAETYYSVTASLRHDAKILWRYLLGLFGPRSEPPASNDRPRAASHSCDRESEESAQHEREREVMEVS